MKILFCLSVWIIGCSVAINEYTVAVTELPQRKTKLTQEEIKSLDSVDVHFHLRGGCYAYSSNKNAIASNGEAHSNNTAQAVDGTFPREGFYLIINRNELIKIDGGKLGCKLYLVNTSDSLVNLSASDSRLYIVAEALNEDNIWQPITYLQSSWCGNSYHTVALDTNEFWEFDIPVFKGELKTKVRYTLSLGNKGQIHSNEIVAFINRDQFDVTKKQ
ncbi:MAG: hypothetical protein ABIQ40_11355 [Bacteroidia bacterium]